MTEAIEEIRKAVESWDGDALVTIEQGESLVQHLHAALANPYAEAGDGRNPMTSDDAHMIAFELRTANMLAALDVKWADGSAMFPAEGYTLRADVLARLGYIENERSDR